MISQSPVKAEPVNFAVWDDGTNHELIVIEESDRKVEHRHRHGLFSLLVLELSDHVSFDGVKPPEGFEDCPELAVSFLELDAY